MQEIVLVSLLLLLLVQTMLLFLIFTTLAGVKITLPFIFFNQKDKFTVKKQTKPLDQFIPNFKKPINIEIKDIEEDKYTVRS